jgi:hypothetical protein
MEREAAEAAGVKTVAGVVRKTRKNKIDPPAEPLSIAPTLPENWPLLLSRAGKSAK